MSAPTRPDHDLLVAFTNAWPELDAVRWRVRLPNGQWTYIEGDKIDHPTDPCGLAFTLDDGTTREFAMGEWTSASGIPGKPEPDAGKIVARLFMFGLADLEDMRDPNSWLIAQPEWMAHQRTRLDNDPEALRPYERMHTLHRLDLL